MELIKYTIPIKGDANVWEDLRNIKTSASFATVYKYLRKKKEDAFAKRIFKKRKREIALDVLPKWYTRTGNALVFSISI